MLFFHCFSNISSSNLLFECLDFNFCICLSDFCSIFGSLNCAWMVVVIQGSSVSMNTRGRKECLISPECRSYGRSRSGENKI